MNPVQNQKTIKYNELHEHALIPLWNEAYYSLIS